MDNITNYIELSLGIKPIIKEVKANNLERLPLFINSTYKLYIIEIMGQEFVLLEVKHDFSIKMLIKHLAIIKNAFSKKCIVVFEKLEAYKRKRMIEKKIPFIVSDKQMYLPDLLIDLKEFGNQTSIPERMNPASQFLLLYHILIKDLEGLNFKSIAELLNYDAATITRSAQYLLKYNLCKLKGSKEKLLHFELNKKELWRASEPLMNNPVKRKQYYNGWIDYANAIKTNINALSFYSDLNDEAIEYYAFTSDKLKIIEGVNMQKTPLMEGNICIEVWKYEASMLTTNNYIDPLSLYLCFREDEDERVEMALEQIINQIKW